MKTKIVNLSIRIFTLACKFLLTTYIVKFLGLEANGDYGIFFTSVTLAVYCIGLDFYVYSTREILQNSEIKDSVKLSSHMVILIASYGLALIVILALNSLGVNVSKYIVYFITILLLDFISTELYRLLVIRSEAIKANLNLLIRSGIWVPFIIFLWLFDYSEFKNIEAIFAFWSIGSFCSILFSLWFLRNDIKKISFTKVNLIWIKTGILVAIPFFVSTFSLKLVMLSDRYIIDYFLGSESTGIYVFFGSIVNMIETFIQTTVIMIYSPLLVKNYSLSKDEFSDFFSRFKKEVFLYTAIATLGASLLIFPLLWFVNDEKLFDNLATYYLLLFGKMLFCFSLIYHFLLYVSKNDKSIIWSTLITVIISIALNLFLVPIYGISGSAITSLISFGTLFILKWHLASKRKI